MKKYNLSPQQKNIFEMVKRYENTSIGNIGGIMYMDKDRSPEQVYLTVCRMQELNPALRLCVNNKGDLYLSDSDEVFFEVVDERMVSEQESDAHIQEWMNQPLFCYDTIMVRYYLIKRKEYDCLLGIYHHLICDGIGLQKVTQQFYTLSRNAESPLWTSEEKPDMRYIQYLEELMQGGESNRKIAGLKWYGEHFNAEPVNLPVRRESFSEKANVFKRQIKGADYEEIQEWCREYSLTVEHLYEAGYACYCNAINGNSWISFGRVMINRKKKYMDTVGMFTNVLPLVMQLRKDMSFLELCTEIRKQEFEMFKFSDITVEEIKKAGQLTGRMYDTCFTYRPTKRLPMEHAEYIKEIECSAVEVPLRIVLDEEKDRLVITYKYMTDVYTEKEIQALDERLEDIIKRGIQDGDLYTEEVLISNKEQGVKRESSYSHSECKGDVLDEFYRGVKAHPTQTFIIDCSQPDGKYLTYEEAAAWVDRIEQKLRRQIQSLEQKEEHQIIVGLKLSRTCWMPLSMLACLGIGAVFFPISVEESEANISQMSDRMDIMLTDKWFACLPDKEGGEVPKEQDSYSNDWQQGEIAYVINTSGSTGKPKLVQVYRSALNLRLHWMIDTFEMEGSRVLQKTRNTFDVSIWELLLPAMCHSSLVMLPDGMEKNPEAIAEIVMKYKVDKIHFVPSMLSVFLTWLESHNRDLENVWTDVFSSGEALSPSLVERFYKRFPNVRLHNLYGPAECTIDVSYHRCMPGEHIIPIGRPVWNTELKIVNTYGKEIPDGYIGEILIVGDLVGKGYLGNPKESEKRFLQIEGQSGYRTGDLGYIAENGEIIYVGRMDREIKLRGMRVNLTVLEQEASAIPGIKGAATMVIKKRLILFLETKLDREKIKFCLSQRVTPHYLPDVIQIVDNIPFNRCGKCDYHKLKEYYERQIATKKDAEEPSKGNDSALERLVTSCVEKVLQKSIASLDENLFDCGMDSLSVVELLVELEHHGYVIRYEEVYVAGTIRKLAKRLEEGQRKERENVSIFRSYPDWNQGICNIVKQGRTRIVIAVPYAGMDVHIFHEIARSLTSAGCNFLAYDTKNVEGSVEEIATIAENELQPLLSGENIEIMIIGCCVGSALALETALKLQKYPQVKSKMVLIGSLPASFIGSSGQKKLVWDILPKMLGEVLVSGLDGRRIIMTEEMYNRLRKEAKKYVGYMERATRKRQRIKIDTLLIFGKQDILTYGYRRRFRQWKNYIAGSLKVVGIKGAKHYCTRTHGKKIAALIMKMF